MCFNGEKSSICYKPGMFCHFSLQRTHALYIFRAVFSLWSYGGQIITQITCYCSSFITSLIMKGALRGKLLCCSERQRGAAPHPQSHSTDTLGSHCRTREVQHLHLRAFHTIPVQTEIAAQNTSQRRVRLGILLYLICAHCRQQPWFALVYLQHLI